MALLKTFDFKDFKVEMSSHSLTYIVSSEKHGTLSIFLPYFNNSIDPDTDGGGIHIKQMGFTGSGMTFTHYAPGDLRGMFEFIARGYKVFERFKKDEDGQ